MNRDDGLLRRERKRTGVHRGEAERRGWAAEQAGLLGKKGRVWVGLG